MNRNIFTIFLLSLGINFLLAFFINQTHYLSAEEISVSYLSPLFLLLRLQFDHFSTNFFGQFLFLLSKYIFPQENILYVRYYKAILMAVVPLLFYFIILELKVSRQAAFLTTILYSLSPGLTAFSWLAIETGLELIFAQISLLVLLKLNSKNYFTNLFFSALFFAFSLLTYPSAIFFLPFVVITLLNNFKKKNNLNILPLFFFIIIFIFTLLIPYFWWENIYALLKGGGGSFSFVNSLQNFLHLFKEIFLRGDSYYYFSPYSALGSIILIPILIYSFLNLTKFKKEIIASFLFTIALYSFSSGVIGFRRLLPLHWLFYILLSFGIDSILNLDFMKQKKIPMNLLFFLLLLPSLFLQGQQQLYYYKKKVAFPHDFILTGSRELDVTNQSTLLREYFDQDDMQEILNHKESFRLLALYYFHMKERCQKEERICKHQKPLLNLIKKRYLSDGPSLHACENSILCFHQRREKLYHDL